MTYFLPTEKMGSRTAKVIAHGKTFLKALAAERQTTERVLQAIERALQAEIALNFAREETENTLSTWMKPSAIWNSYSSGYPPNVGRRTTQSDGWRV
jgi:hypothetical protein